MAQILSAFIVIVLGIALSWVDQPNAAPVPHFIEGRHFSADLRNFNQIVQLLYNIRSRIGVPFSAMTNVGIELPQMLEINPLDLALLPSGYCYSCDDVAHSAPDDSQPPSPFKNHMVEIDEKQIVVICAETDEEHGAELPFVKACPGQQEVLKQFLVDLRSRGSRLAIPKERLEKAPILEWKYAMGQGGYRAMPAERKTIETLDGRGPPAVATSHNFETFLQSVYQGERMKSAPSSPISSVSSAISSVVPPRREPNWPSEDPQGFWSSDSIFLPSSLALPGLASVQASTTSGSSAWTTSVMYLSSINYDSLGVSVSGSITQSIAQQPASHPTQTCSSSSFFTSTIELITIYTVSSSIPTPTPTPSRPAISTSSFIELSATHISAVTPQSAKGLKASSKRVQTLSTSTTQFSSSTLGSLARGISESTTITSASLPSISNSYPVPSSTTGSMSSSSLSRLPKNASTFDPLNSYFSLAMALLKSSMDSLIQFDLYIAPSIASIFAPLVTASPASEAGPEPLTGQSISSNLSAVTSSLSINELAAENDYFSVDDALTAETEPKTIFDRGIASQSRGVMSRRTDDCQISNSEPKVGSHIGMEKRFPLSSNSWICWFTRLVCYKCQCGTEK